MNKQICPICKKEKLTNQFVRGIVVWEELAQPNRLDIPGLRAKGPKCKSDLSHYQALVLQPSLDKKKYYSILKSGLILPAE